MMPAAIQGKLRRRWYPYLVLAIALVLPGAGHVICGQPRRGLTLQLFMISMAFITWQLSSPDRNIVGRLAGGLFVYALSLPEAYRMARLRALSRQRQPETSGEPGIAELGVVSATTDRA